MLFVWLLNFWFAFGAAVVNGGGFSPVDKGNSPKSNKTDRAAIKKLLVADSTKCHYTHFGDEVSVTEEYTRQKPRGGDRIYPAKPYDDKATR